MTQQRSQAGYRSAIRGCTGQICLIVELRLFLQIDRYRQQIADAARALIAEARIAYGGRGVSSDLQRPTWGQDVLNRFAPF